MEEARFDLLQELLTCGDRVCSWVYSSHFDLIRTNSRQLVLHTIFDHIGCLAYMKEHFEADPAPLILSSYLGLVWGAAMGEATEGTQAVRHYYVIGPVLNTDISMDAIRDAAYQFDIDPTWRSGFTELMAGLPVVSSPLFFQYTLMLHYCATGEKLERSDIRFQQSDQFQQKSKHGTKRDAAPKNRFRVYQSEQALLRNIREGDLDYAHTLERAGQLSNGVRISTKNPISQAVISTTGFATLCVRAAIEGGLSPDLAYSLGDGYIQSMIGCTNITDLRTINHAMYEDFVQRVHKQRTNPHYSKQVQSCIDYIEMNLLEPLTIRELAQRVGYTEYYLSHKFKQETNVTIKEYIRYARVERAKTLLTTTDCSVAEIAEQLHFCSSSYFSSVFEEISGSLPNQYRKERQRL